MLQLRSATRWMLVESRINVTYCINDYQALIYKILIEIEIDRVRYIVNFTFSGTNIV